MAQQIETATQRTEHTQRQNIHLEQPDRIQIVLVPLDNRALGHTGIFDRHQRMQRSFGNHKTARVLRQMTGKTYQLPCQGQNSMQCRIVRVKAGLGETLGIR